MRLPSNITSTHDARNHALENKSCDSAPDNQLPVADEAAAACQYDSREVYS